MTSVATASLDYAGASQGPAAAFKQRRADLNALKTALQSGVPVHRNETRLCA
jgi:hypothetical protein